MLLDIYMVVIIKTIHEHLMVADSCTYENIDPYAPLLDDGNASLREVEKIERHG